MTPAHSESYEISGQKAVEQLKPSLVPIGKWMRKMGWRFYESGHGRVAVCPSGDCDFQLNSTPGNPDWDAKRARDRLTTCGHLSDPPPRKNLLKKFQKKFGKAPWK